MALSANSPQGTTISRFLNKLKYAFTDVASDLTTATTSDIVVMLDASDNYTPKYADSANVFELLGERYQAALSQLALGRLIRSVELFGFHLFTLDLRQNADVHERVAAGADCAPVFGAYCALVTGDDAVRSRNEVIPCDGVAVDTYSISGGGYETEYLTIRSPRANAEIAAISSLVSVTSGASSATSGASGASVAR